MAGGEGGGTAAQIQPEFHLRGCSSACPFPWQQLWRNPLDFRSVWQPEFLKLFA